MTAPARLSPAVLTSGVAGVALALTTAVALLPFTRFAYRAPVLHAVLETAEGCIALAVAYLLYGRYRRTGSTRSLLVTYALVATAVANLALQAVPRAVASDALTAWAPLTVRLLGVGLLTCAALSPESARTGPATARAGLAACATAVAVVLGAALAYGDRLPAAVDAGLDPSDSTTPVLGGHPVALGAQVVSGLLYAVASVAFTRQAREDELQRWLGAGCALAAVARVNYLLFPSLYSEYVFTGDVLRLGFYLLLLVGATREVRSYWQDAAVLEDRRRLARDLHDGLTQELSYIWSQSRLLPPGDLVGERINGAAARALDEARTAIAALTRTASGSFAEVLQQSADGLSSRYGVEVDVRVDPGADPTPERADAVLRIVSEALRNAVRHGGATRVVVEVSSSPLGVAIRDDGAGFSGSVPVTTSGGGFGLTSMRERAEGLGASFDLRSQAGSGTTVEVQWP